jgi:regulatory protein
VAGGAQQAPARSPRSLKARAIQLLAQREHSRLELRRKLLPHAAAADADARGVAGGDAADPAGDEGAARAQAQLEALLDWLEANHYLSQQRFVESRVHARAARFGNLRIRQELAQHQVGLPADVESSLRDTELDRARAVWRARFSSHPADAAERVKQARFLAGRGFGGEVIHRVLREAGPSAAKDDEVNSDTD